VKPLRASQAGGVWAGISLALGLAALGCGVLEAPVARTVEGVTTEGRFIEPEAYALYAVAALREARGQWGDALNLYQRALDVDGRGPELRTRIGAVACKLRRDTLADRAFSAAQRSDASYGPLWFELALCRRARGDFAGALVAALEAVRLDPERIEASLVAAELAERQGNAALAWQLRDGLSTHAPDSPLVQKNLLAAATTAGDGARVERARAALRKLAERADRERVPEGIALALAALAQGDVPRAMAEAERLLGADPGNGDALVIALAAADLAQDHQAFATLLERSREPGTPASPEVLSTLAALLGRRVSAQAAQLVVPQP
jgi:tetratricopeptide (TPR) repeat protein